MSEAKPIAAPPLDPRSAEQVLADLEALLKVHAPTDITPGSGAAAGIAGVFARYAELVIERLNRAPDKNRLAFFDLIGASPQPPQPARVPLVFSLAVGASEARVPARTPVAAPAGPGRSQPVIYETERELALTPVRLTRLISWDAPADRWTDLAATLSAGDGSPQRLFHGEQAIEHSVYIGQAQLLRLTVIHEVYVNYEQQQPQLARIDQARDGIDDRRVQWQIWEDGNAADIRPGMLQRYQMTYAPDDLNCQLTLGGNLNFSFQPPLHDRKRPIALTSVGGQTSRWLKCRLLTPVNPGAEADPAKVRSAQLPQLSAVTLNTNAWSGLLTPDAAFANAQALDVASDFFPFGPNPQPGAVWYIASREVFSQVGLGIQVQFELSNPNTAPYPSCPRSPITLAWEYWDGNVWRELGRGSLNGRTTDYGDAHFFDGTGVFLNGLGNATFVFPMPPQPTVVRGIDNYWLRVRIVSGVYEKVVSGVYVPAPPSFASAKLSYNNASVIDPSTGQVLRLAPDAVVRFDGLQYQSLDPVNFEPFQLAEDSGRSLYAGFEMPRSLAAFPQRPISLYLDLAQPAYGTEPDNTAATRPARLDWSCWNGTEWLPITVLDETAGLAHSGLIEFLPPADFAARALFDEQPRHWLRAAWASGDYRYLPRLRRVLQNAAVAMQATTVASEILGSSNGEPDQRYSAARKPLLSGLLLEVREPALPSAVERAALIAAEGVAAIGAEVEGGVWLRWHAVGDFHASGPRDRHYVVDHLNGELRFGNGRSGLIPPRGVGNIRLRDYQSGGGTGGNAAAGAITQLKTSLPSVSGVSQPLPATGGVPAESTERLLDRVPRSIRHGDRAVTAEDYEDLARLASTEVARCLCVPLQDVRDTREPAERKPGLVSLVIVPHATDLRPTPGALLIATVRDFLDARRLPGVELVVLGAEYVSVDVSAELGLVDAAAARAVEQAALDALQAFLHPLTGGHLGSGWDFGRRPHKSDLYALLEAVPGVDHVRRLSITEHVDRPGANTTTRFLVCSGSHRISLRLGA